MVLTGRSPLDTDKRDRLDGLSAHGRVTYRQVDLGDLDQVTRLVAAIDGEDGPLAGILHTAGMVADNFILKKTNIEFREVLAPKVVGTFNLDLATRDVDFTPIGPQTTFMTGLKLSADRKTGYLVAYRDILGNRHTEFWVFDLTTRKLINTVEFPGPTQIRVTISGNGRSIFIYGSAPMMDVYDTATLKIKKTLDMDADLSSTMLVVPPTA